MSFKFKIKLAPAVATIIVLPILMSLGFWQLDRAEIKQKTLEVFNQRVQQSPRLITNNDKPAEIGADNLQYTQLESKGHYDTQHSYLIDNRVHQSQVGFYVISPFIVENSNHVLLVNRGWIKAKRYRHDLPEFSTPTSLRVLKGMAYLPSKNFFAVDNVKIEDSNKPVILQNVDFEGISSVLNKKVYPFVLRLAPEEPSGFVREWQIVTSPPEKSQSYAAQWFTMAFVVILLFLSSCIKVKREKTE